MTDHRATLAVVGKEICAMRENAGLSQDTVSHALSKNGRDWCSKLERGLINISLCDYLEVMDFLRDVPNKDHPAHALSTHFKRRRTHTTH